MPESPAAAPLAGFRSARASVLAAYLSLAVGIALGGIGVTLLVQLLPPDWRWIGPVVIGLLVAAMVVEPITSHWFTRYTVTADAVIEESGWIDRKVKTLRWSRVQAVDRSTEWQLRLFGLANLRIAQSGQDAAQIEIRGIRSATIEQVLERARLGGATAAVAAIDEPSTATGIERPDDDAEPRSSDDAEPAATSERLLYRATTWDLAVMSVMFGAAVLTVPALAFGAWEAAEQFGLQAWLTGVIGGLEPVSAAILAGLAAVVLGALGTILRYHGFSVLRAGAELRIRHGLLISHERSFREDSIQGVVVQRNLLEQCSGRARLWLLTLDANEQLGKNLVLPSLPVRVVERIARESFPGRVPLTGTLLARRPPLLTTLVTTALAVAIVGSTYAALTWGLAWPILLAGASALVALATVSAICRVLLARLATDPHSELLLLRRTYLTESLRCVDIAAVRRVSARRLPAWLSPRGRRLLPSAAIYAGKAVTLRALHADAAAVERIRAVSVAHAPLVAARTLAQHRA
ncbi:PH domain-containing protein [Agrococcus sp. 1P02AA]|uniref:PH domain-containing protein n=1 Tax=Agrococcus sp. 1P02AA TaxID=3132259 RepID=UPI0039A4F1F2